MQVIVKESDICMVNLLKLMASYFCTENAKFQKCVNLSKRYVSRILVYEERPTQSPLRSFADITHTSALFCRAMSKQRTKPYANDSYSYLKAKISEVVASVAYVSLVLNCCDLETTSFSSSVYF